MASVNDEVADHLNEFMIELCYRKMLKADSKVIQMHWFNRMGFYVRQRSPAQVMQMEAERGL